MVVPVLCRYHRAWYLEGGITFLPLFICFIDVDCSIKSKRKSSCFVYNTALWLHDTVQLEGEFGGVVMTRDEKITLVSSHCEVGRWRCAGAGEIYAPVYIAGRYVFDLFGDNGTNRLYNPSGEVWTESVDEVLNRMSDEALDDLVRIVEEGPRYLRCEMCGEALVAIDERYEDESPNASSMWYEQLIDEHYERYHN